TKIQRPDEFHDSSPSKAFTRPGEVGCAPVLVPALSWLLCFLVVHFPIAEFRLKHTRILLRFGFRFFSFTAIYECKTFAEDTFSDSHSVAACFNGHEQSAIGRSFVAAHSSETANPARRPHVFRLLRSRRADGNRPDCRRRRQT